MVFTVLDFGSMTPESREWMLVTMLVSMPGLPVGGMGGWLMVGVSLIPNPGNVHNRQ